MAAQEQPENTLEKSHRKSQSKLNEGYTVILTGWKPGLKKVSVTRRIEHEIGSLSDAKQCTDTLLEGNEVFIVTQGMKRAEELTKDLEILGVECHIE